MQRFLLTGMVLFSGVYTGQASAFESHGYFRSGIGGSRGGTSQVCFRDPGTEGASGKFRLGNECETYIELDFEQDFRGGEAKDKKATNEPYFLGNVRFALTSGERRDWEPDTTNLNDPHDPAKGTSQEYTTALREAYVQGVNVFGPDVKAWAGKRFYRRYDIHMLDYYFLETAGPGAGVEDINVGFAKLQLADLRNTPAPTAGDGPVQNNVDLRLTDIKMPGGGDLTAVYLYGTAGESGSQTGSKLWEPVSGSQIALIHAQPKVLGGDNQFVIQYGQGIYGGDAGGDQSTLSAYGAWGTQNITKGDTDAKKARDKSSTLRVIEHLVMSPSKSFAAEAVVLYQHVDFGGAKRKIDGGVRDVPAKVETTAGIRPVYHIDNVHDLAFEYGYTKVQDVLASDASDPSNAKRLAAPTLQKFTIAPQLTSGPSYWGRPQIRLFGTYAMWNDDAKGSVGAPVYGQNTSGFSTGAQVETWW